MKQGITIISFLLLITFALGFGMLFKNKIVEGHGGGGHGGGFGGHSGGFGGYGGSFGGRGKGGSWSHGGYRGYGGYGGYGGAYAFNPVYYSGGYGGDYYLDDILNPYYIVRRPYPPYFY